jgi:hypothetical protein
MNCARLILLSFGFTFCSVEANSGIYVPLYPPKTQDIVAFSNSPPPEQSFGSRHVATRETILTFLRRGKNNLNTSSWYKLQYPHPGKLDFCDGVLVDRHGQFYFWFLRTPKVLKLETSDGRTALMQLP